jgi:hypothetical protein
VSYQNALARGHLLASGKRVPGEQDSVRSHVVTSELDIGLTDRIGLSLSLPFVTSRYGGASPHTVGVHGEPTSVDDGSYHGAFQDFRVAARVNVVTRPVVLTPFVEGIVPSHEYESRGHSVVGLDLRALVLGTNVGGFLDALPGTYFHAQASYAVVEKVAGIRANRSRVDAEIGYFVTPRLALRFLESFQFTHDGLEFVLDAPPRPQELNLNHDRINRFNFVNVGAGFGFAINDSLDLFVLGSRLVWGQNIHPHQGFAVGLNMHFRTGRGAVGPSRNPGPRLGLRERSKPPRS